MTSPAFTVRPDTTLAQAARTMARAKVKRLPVVDALGLLQGVVSRADLLKVFLRTDEEIAEEVRREVVSYLFPAPGSRVRVEVADGVVKLAGQVRDTSLVPVAARLIRAVEGVVDVDFDLTRHTDPTGPGDALGDDRPRAHGGLLPDGAPSRTTPRQPRRPARSDRVARRVAMRGAPPAHHGGAPGRVVLAG